MTRSRSSAWLWVMTATNAPSGARRAVATGRRPGCRHVGGPDVRGNAPGRASIQVTANGSGASATRERAPDMARAEQIERRRLGAEALDHATVGTARHRRVRAIPLRARRDTAHEPAIASGRRDRDQRAVALGLRQRRDRVLSAAPKRSIVSSTRPPQHWPRSGPSALSSREAAGPCAAPAALGPRASALHSSAPPPIVPVKRAVGRAPPCGRRPRAGSSPAPARGSPAPPRRARR